MSCASNVIDPQIVASIVFEEKMHGVWAYRKNLLSFYLNLGEVYPHNSYSFGEMQVELTAELMNIDKRNPDWLYETLVVIFTDVNGDVIAIPNGCQGTCLADPELQVETWKFDPSLKLNL